MCFSTLIAQTTVTAAVKTSPIAQSLPEASLLWNLAAIAPVAHLQRRCRAAFKMTIIKGDHLCTGKAARAQCAVRGPRVSVPHDAAAE